MTFMCVLFALSLRCRGDPATAPGPLAKQPGLSPKPRPGPSPTPVGPRALDPYNPEMVHTLQSLLAPALMSRLVLVINHVLGAEPAATQRLAPHAGALITVQFDGWPSLLPAPPALLWRVTPAGLLEWCEAPVPGAEPALRVRIDGSNPLRLMAGAVSGQMPSVDIDGDAQLAADINWLLQNLRWDVAADLERVFGPAVAHALHRLGSALARGLRSATQNAAGVAERMRPTAP